MKFKKVKELTNKTLLVEDENKELWVLKYVKDWRLEHFKRLTDILLGLPYSFFPTSWYVGYDAEGKPILLYKYIYYPSLFDLREEISKNKNLAFLISYKIAKYLKILHDHGIIHGDIKPENILFDFENGKIIFIDFEHFRFTRDKFASLCIGFSPYHACKEQLEGYITVKTDIRCFALSSFEIYLGKHPFEDYIKNMDSLEKIAREVSYLEIRINTQDPLINIMAKMTAVEPDERPSLEIFLKEFEKKIKKAV